MTKIQLKRYNVIELGTSDLTKTNGGFWGAFIAGYILSEILDGIQEGIKTDCSEVC